MEVNGNQGPVQPSNNFSYYNDEKKGKKKKGMGPIKGIFIAIVIVLIICILGLLIRMVIAGDGDYFKPIKTIFGIEEENKKEKRKSSNSVVEEDIVSEPSSGFSERYSLLSSDVEDDDVKHYRMTLDLSDMMDTLFDSMSAAQSGFGNSSSSSSSIFDDDEDSDYNYFDNDYDSDYLDDEDSDSDYYDDDTNYFDDEDSDYDNDTNYFTQTTDLNFSDSIFGGENNYFTNDDEDTDTDLSSDDIYSDNRFRSNFDVGDNGTATTDDSLESKVSDYASAFGLLMAQMGDQIKDIVSGEIYVDIYFKGNEIIQVICGVDYSELVQNLYDYVVDNADEDALEEMENEDIESAEDYADYILREINKSFDMEDVYDQMFEDETVEESLLEKGITRKNIEDAMDIHFDRGIAEFYFTGSSKINKLFKEYFESDEFKEELDELSNDGVEIDEDNIIEDMLNYSNDQEENQEYGMEFVEID